MLNKHLDRCERICGQEKKDRCFVHNQNQVHCLADMAVNKAMGVKHMIEMAAGQDSPNKIMSTLNRATDSLQALMDWVKYLRVVQDLRDLRFNESNSNDRRRDDRYSLPDVYQKHVFMVLNYQSKVENVSVLDFSQHGMRFQGFKPISLGVDIDCRLSTTSGLAEEISFQVRVAHCQPSDDKFIMGVEIISIDDDDAFQVYKKLYDFILKLASMDDI